LKKVVAGCVEGAKILELCKMGDSQIASECSAYYKKPKDGVKVEKGLFFPSPFC